MIVVNSPKEMQEIALKKKKENSTIAVVPTMGYLHAGHISLIDIARAKADFVIVTLFVNPTQFGANEDLSSYPRNFERDSEICLKHGADVLFAPKNEDMYSPYASTFVDEVELSKKLCGKSRPIHFRGVCTVVTKLFNITQANIAVFGEKDAQQLRIIKRMVEDLNFPIKIIGAPLIRDCDGVALSSRNSYLSSEERKNAVVLSSALNSAKLSLERAGFIAVEDIAEVLRETIKSYATELDYVEIYDSDTLNVPNENSKELIIAVAAKFGKTRLIDNMIAKITNPKKIEW